MKHSTGARRVSTIHARIAAITIAVGVGGVAGMPRAMAQPAPSTFSAWTSDWSPTGNLGEARAAGTATLLTTGPYAGRVLHVGGNTGINSTNSAEIYDPVTATGIWAGYMAQGRYFHTATMLADGRVLIVGGAGATGTMASAELYDPATSSFSPAGSMASGRYLHTATLLPNGYVLVAGGLGAAGTLASAEVYIPPTTANPTGSWNLVGTLGVARFAHTATVLPNGSVLVAGGYSSGGVTDTAETFSTTSYTFSFTHPMAYARAYHTATATGTGVVMIGGYGSAGEVGAMETYSGTLFYYQGVSLNDPRDSHTATLLPGGDILVTGGEDAAGVGSTSVEVYSAALGFVVKASMATGRLYHTATLMPNGDVLIAGGMSYTPTFLMPTACELYDTLFVSPPNAAIPSGLENQTATPITAGAEAGQVLIAGGDTGPGFTGTQSTMFFVPAKNSFVPGPSMTTARFMHTATPLPGGSILMVGGKNGTQPMAGAEVYVPSRVRLLCLRPPFGDGCVEIVRPPASFHATAGAPLTARYWHTATFIPSINKVLVTGGFTSSNTGTKTAELYDPATDSFTATGSMDRDRFGHTATLIMVGGQERVLVTGGYSNVAQGIAFSTEIYDPATGTFALQPSANTLLTNREFHQATLLANGQVLISGGITSGYTPTAAAEVYDPTGNYFLGAGNMSQPRAFHTATLTPLAGGKVVVAGGNTLSTSTQTATVDLFDPSTRTFAPTVEPLRMARSRHTATLMSDGRLLFAGGLPFPGSVYPEVSKIMN